METFVVYDARREQAFVRFPCDASARAESGYLNAGLWVEFGPGDPARMLMVVVEHPFFARSAGFVDEVTALVGRTVVQRLRECHLREETVVDAVDVDEIEALKPAWENARRELRDRHSPNHLPAADVDWQADLERQWLIPIRLEPVMARTVRQPVAVRTVFDGRIELPADLADTLRVERIVRIGIADRVMRVRGRVRDGEEPPSEVRLRVAGVDDDVALSYDPDLGELGAEMALDGPLSTLGDGEVVSLLMLRVRQERTG
jgi:hypothetical protein